jgi:hypothetical protein
MKYIQYMKIVRENIFEKFEEDSDPIKDLDIGIPFAYIKSGYIISNKEGTYSYMYLDKFKGKLSCKLCFKNIKNNYDYNNLFILSPEHYSIVMNVQYKNDNLYIEAIPFSNKKAAEYLYRNRRDIYKNDRSWKSSLIWYRREAPILTWDKYFRIIDKNLA